MESYIIAEMVEEKKWIISDIRYYARPDVEWILHWGSCLDPKDALIFTSKLKAQKVVEIINNQKGGTRDNNFFVEAL